MHRGKKSLLNAISAMLLIFFNGLLSMVVTNLIIKTYGSDFNGLNSTVSQIVSILMLFEGGFTIATNVALFKPYYQKDYDSVNGILSATYIKFKKIGFLFFMAGTIVAVVYTFIVNSGLPNEFIFAVMLMTILPAAFNLIFATKYRILLQADQKEYVISFITFFTTCLGHIINIILILQHGQMWLIRFITMIMALLNSFLIFSYVKKRYSFINYKTKPDFSSIKGTRDVLIQKITGVIYNTTPILFISISPEGGTLLASVYAVYNNVFVLLKGIMQGIIDAPRLSIGEMLSYKNKEEVWPIFKLYQLVVFFILFALLLTAGVLIMPFVKIYTAGISDIDYQKPVIAFLLVAISFFEIIHIPSGHLINMSGNFNISKKIQSFATIFLIITMFIGFIVKGIYGILFAVLLTAVLLAVFEIGYVHLKFFDKKLLSFFALLLPFLLLAIPLGFIELYFSPKIDSFLTFFVVTIILVTINIIISFLIGLLFNRRDTVELIKKAVFFIRPTK